jgi:hypothetical protein
VLAKPGPGHRGLPIWAVVEHAHGPVGFLREAVFEWGMRRGGKEGSRGSCSTYHGLVQEFGRLQHGSPQEQGAIPGVINLHARIGLLQWCGGGATGDVGPCEEEQVHNLSAPVWSEDLGRQQLAVFGGEAVDAVHILRAMLALQGTDAWDHRRCVGSSPFCSSPSGGGRTASEEAKVGSAEMARVAASPCQRYG